MRYSPNGQYIAYEHRAEPRGIDIARANTGVVVASLPAGQNPRWVNSTNLVAESPDGRPGGAFSNGFAINYIPANRGQLDANGTGVWAVSEPIGTTDVHGMMLPVQITDAREPRIDGSGRNLAVRHPATGVVRFEPSGLELGLAENARWSSETLVWWLDGRVWGRTTPDAPTVELTVPGRACFHACPLWHATNGLLYVGLVIDNGELWIGEWGSLVRREGLGWRVAVSGGSAFDWTMQPHDEHVDVCYFDPHGAPVFTAVNTALPPESMLKPPAPEPLPDIAWTPDANRTVDMLDFYKAASSAVIDHGDGTGQLWLHKSPERDNWGEWKDWDAQYIGFVEDSSMGTRQITIPPSKPKPQSDPWTNTVRDRWSPEAILEWNANHPDENVGDPLTLPISSHTWLGNRVQAIRHVTGRAEITFTTQFDFWDETEWFPVAGAVPPRGRWELHPPQEITSIIETGYGRINGHEYFARQGYVKPFHDPEIPYSDSEWNAWGPHGWIGFFAYGADGELDVSSVKPAGPWEMPQEPYVPSRFTPTWPIYDPEREPPPDPEPPPGDDMTHDELRGYMARLDDPLIFGALQRFHNEVLPRDRPVDPVTNAEGGPFNVADVVTGGAMGYFLRHYCIESAIAQDKGRTPAESSGDGYDIAIQAYRDVVDPQ